MTDAPKDALGWRLKVGVVMPSTNTIVQPETDAVRVPGVTWHTGRIPITNRKISSDNFLDHVAAMRAGIETATDQVKTAGIDCLIMAVALEAFWGGVAQSRKLREGLEAHAGVPVILGSEAVADALTAVGARTIAVLTPHMPKGDVEVRGWLEESGFAVARLKGLECSSPRAIAEVPQDTIRAELRALDGEDVDALVQVGTNLAGAAVAAELEREIAKPVIQINTVSAWAALRRSGIDDKVEGRGLILERH
ncbi:maleate cis-trans isomerase family protein [Jannaschia formosa]|uniref:maleate cis-trans isomerase family protein n=1 Tax=Jannaschia formosa TaxID=2259592 RepID=UPI000E1BC818|nr:Asp/Glu racemase [Jannaschia formosa]TFL16509.1 Asp/Glu racemase [Jannaschia formosa]